MHLRCLHRSYSNSHEILTAPSLALAPLDAPVHPRNNHVGGRGPAAIFRPLQQLHNGDIQPATKLASSSPANPPNDMDTDGEIDIDDCDDCEYQPPAGSKTPQRSRVRWFNADCRVKTCITQLALLEMSNRRAASGGEPLQDRLCATSPPGV